MVGTNSIEKGHFGEFQLPDDFDKSKLILISSLGFEVLSTTWIKLKLLLVILLTLYHFYLSKLLSDFNLDQNTKSSKFFRIINEVPTILLILIVFIVVFKPI